MGRLHFLMQNGNSEWSYDKQRDYIFGFMCEKNRFESVRESHSFRSFKEEFLSGKYKLIDKPIKIGGH